MLRKLTAVFMLVFISTACATREGEVTDLGALAKVFSEAARTTALEDADGDNPQVRSAAATGVATIVADALVVTTPGKMPKKANLSAQESNFRVAANRTGPEGWVALAVASTVDELGILREARVKSFNKLQVTVSGDKKQSNYDSDVFGAYVCGSTNSAAKKMTAKFKLKGPQNVPGGTIGVFAFARVPLTLLGLSPAQWEQTCNSATDLLPSLRAVVDAQAESALTR